jgi:erythromycin esterase
VLSRGGRFFGPIPDALMAVLMALAALASFVPMPYFFATAQLDLFFVLVVEGGFLLMQGTLVDIATRLKKRPPVWVIPIIVIAVLVFSSGALDVLKMAWQRGAVAFLPLLISLAERGTVLWNMPNRTRIQKIAARALIANRITTGMVLLGLTTLAMITGVVFNLYDWFALGSWPPFAAGAIYFAVAAFDDWRVRTPRFAERPRVLFRFDPIGIEYLAPLALVLLFAAPLEAQDSDARVTWLAERASRLRSVDPADGEFHDLEPLRRALKDVRVVMLGEQNHGDGTTFLAKTRLIRFLHERMGFDVLAFESGFYDCAKDGPRGVFPIWAKSRELQPLLDYLGKRPIEIAGVDIQSSGASLASDLKAYLARIDPKLTDGAEWDRAARVIARLGDSSWELGREPVPPPQEQAAFAETLERWRALIAAHDRTPATEAWSGPFWRQQLASLRVHAEQTWRTDFAKHASNPAVFAMRDRQMGDNLLWLAKERFPKRKIIVWAATFHNARGLGAIETGDPKLDRLYDGVTPMGEIARRELGGELYSLGFTSFEGESATVFRKSANAIPRPSRGSLEDLLARAGLVHAFVDFRDAPGWLRSPLVARLLDHTQMRADWTGVVDGVVFLRSMQRSHAAAAPQGNSWLRARGRHIAVYGERNLSRIARGLAAFERILIELLGESDHAEPCVTILLTESREFFVTAPRTTYLVAKPSTDAAHLGRDIVRAYLRAHRPAAPPWLQTGLTDVLGVFQQTDASVVVGLVHREHMRNVLAAESLDLDSPATAWALTQFLLFEHTPRDLDRSLADVEQPLREWISRRRVTQFSKPLGPVDIQPAPPAEVLVHRGNAVLQDDRAAAIELYRQAVAADPDDANARAMLGVTLKESGRGDEALAHLEFATNAEAGQPLAYLAHAELLLGSRAVRFGATDPPPGPVMHARRLAQKAVALDPSLAAAWAVLAKTWIHDRAGFDEGIAAAERALALDPASQDAALSLLLLHLRNDDLDRALKARETLRATDVADRAVIAWKLHRANALARAGDLAGARALVDSVLLTASDESLRKRLALDLARIELVAQTVRLTEVYNRAVAAANAFQYERALALIDAILSEARDESLRADAEELKRKLTRR